MRGGDLPRVTVEPARGMDQRARADDDRPRATDERARAIARFARENDSVVSRRALIELGAPAGYLAAQARRGVWQRPYPGVAVVHTGPLAWPTRARAALVHCGSDAALSHSAAAYHWGLTRFEPRIIEVSVPRGRRVAPQRGLQVHVRRQMPPSYGDRRAVHPPETVLDLWERTEDVDAAIALLSDAVRARVPLDEIVRGAAHRLRLPRRTLLAELVGETRDGVESPLEHRYRRDVERRHGLPASARQVRDRVSGQWIRSDVVYPEHGLRVELDGSLGHPGGRTGSDTWRDNAVLLERGDLTLRYRWHHVAVTPCRTAAQVAQALTRGGWRGEVRRCSESCSAPGVGR